MNTVIGQDRQIFDDVTAFLTSPAAPYSEYPICIKNSQTQLPHVLFNTEQMTRADLKQNSRKNFNLSVFENPHIVEIWDYSLKNIEIFAQNHITNCRHVPFKLWPAQRAKILSCNPDHEYHHDVAFCGGMNTRRRKITDALADYGILVDVIENSFGDARNARIAKSRLLLNVHFSSDYKIFEQLRCFAWLDTGKVVVSENSLDNDPRCLNTSYESLVATVVEILGNFSAASKTALHHQTPIQALQKWRAEKPDLFVKRVYKQAGLES